MALSDLVSVKCATAGPYQSADGSSFLAPGESADGRATYCRSRYRQLVAMFLPETAMPATIPRLCRHTGVSEVMGSNANERVKRTKRIASNLFTFFDRNRSIHPLPS